MVTSFVNLVSWSFFAKNAQFKKYWRIEVDSVSLGLALRILGIKRDRFSGVEWVQNNRKLLNHGLVLGTEDARVFSNHYVLPFWPEIESIRITESLEQILLDFNGRDIFIGISSPKQEYLALKVRDIAPNSQIYCLGAAVYTRFESKKFLWLVFLVEQPKRTLRKLVRTMLELLKLLLKDNRNELKEVFK